MTDKKEPAQVTFEEKQNDFRDTLRERRKSELLAGWVESLQSKATVDIKPEFL